MELAVNQFNKGLLLDFHPMVQENNVLSDCLNGTMITMSGNEVVLLNDMGNRRVDNAYLPAGYEPVGIKEHGGIIYIAAYNPITHRSLIGSFPSPERNMGEEYNDNGTYFTFDEFLENPLIPYGEEIPFIKNDVILIPLTNDTSLHAGDKFTVYSEYIWSLSDNITNFGKEGTYSAEDKPFNKTFTLSLGILNSQNEFSDITSTLHRFDIDGEIIQNLKNDYDKFNTGYFIAPEFKNNNSTSADTNLINERNKMGANTYAYKLTGPLFLKAELNHIQLFDYDIENSISEEKNTNDKYTITFFITGNATYNCPDSEDYFDFFIKPEGLNEYCKVSESEDNLSTIENSYTKILDNSTGNWISSKTKVYKYEVPEKTGILDYVVAVKSSFSKENQLYYLSNLSEHSTIDISKIGTNSCELSVWKYKNNISDNEIISTLLDFKFDCYKDRETEFNNLQFSLKDLSDISNNIEINLSEILNYNTDVNNGRQQLYIEWNKLDENYKIKFRHLYLVKISYDRKIGNRSDTCKTCRFLLATSLFNSCYDEINNDYVSDYGIFMGEKNENLCCSYSFDEYTMSISIDEHLSGIRNSYLYLNDKIDVGNPEIIVDEKAPTFDHPLAIAILENKPNYDYSEKQFNYKVTIKYSPEWELSNKEQYPQDMLIQSGTTNVALNNLATVVTDKKYTSDYSLESDFNNNIIDIGTVTNELYNRLMNFSIAIRDRIYIDYEKTTKKIGISYVDVSIHSKFFDRIQESMSENLRYNGITFYEHKDDTGYMSIRPALNKTELILTLVPPSDNDKILPKYEGDMEHSIYSEQNWQQTERRELFITGSDDWKLSELYDDYFLPTLLKMNCPFTFILFDQNIFLNCFTCSSNVYTSNVQNDWYRYFSNFLRENGEIKYPLYAASRYCRVWWVNEEGKPIILNKPSFGVFDSGETSSEREKLNNIYKEIIDFIGKVAIIENLRAPWESKQVLNNDGINDYSIRASDIQQPSNFRPKPYQYLILKHDESVTMTGFDIDMSNYNITDTYLVMPLKDCYIKAWYPSSQKYLYSDNTQVNLECTLIYTLTTDYSEVSGNSLNLLKFEIEKGGNITINKKLNKNFIIDTSFSEQLFNISQQLDLDNYSIDLEKSNILSDKDPLTHLYIRNPNNLTQLVEVPRNYPIQLNSGTKYNFPLTCNKEYIKANNHITNEYLVVLPSSSSYPGDIRGELIIWPNSKNIPVLRNTDLYVSSTIFK